MKKYMKKLIFCFGIFLSIILVKGIFVTNVEATTVNLGGTNYQVNVGKEYGTTTDVSWISMQSGRAQGSKVTLEIDLNLIKDYNKQSGVISYQVLKKWLNNLDKAFDYFCELNLKPADKTLIVEITGISNQYASGYANSNSNRIVLNKAYHKGFTLVRMEEAYNLGYYDLNGTVLHEMGHMFTKMEGYSGFNTPWNFWTECINLMMVHYVADKLIQDDPKNFLFVHFTGNMYYISSKAKGTNLEKYLLDKKFYVFNTYCGGWEKQIEINPFFNSNDYNYAYILYNANKMLEIAGQTATKNAFNKYFQIDFKTSKEYNISTGYDKFITFSNILRSCISTTTWNNMIKNYTVLCNILVVDPIFNPTELQIAKGFKQNLAVILNWHGSHQAVTPTFTSMNNDIVTVDSSGNVTAKKVGTTNICVKIGDHYKRVGVNVVDNHATSILLNQWNYTINSASQRPRFTAKVKPETVSQQVRWKSENTKIATIDMNTGVLTPLSNGTVKITATTTDGTNLTTAPALYVVVDFKVTGVTLNHSSYTFNNSNPITLTATISPSNAKNKNISWTSSNPKVAAVDYNGKVTPLSKGSCVITATSTDGGNKNAKCNVTVNVNPSTDYIKGDINQDGKVNVNDVNYGARGLVKNTLTSREKTIGNVNGDSVFNVNDLNKILRFLSGKINSL